MEKYSNRKYFIIVFVVILGLTFIVRLFYLQVIDISYKLSAENNSRRKITIYPSRGLIYDRKGELIVYNQAAYDIMIEPLLLEAFDTLELCKILEIDKSTLTGAIDKRKMYAAARRDPFIKQVSSETFARLQERLYDFPGFYVRPRTLRKYNYPIAAHLLGYVGEVDSSDIKRDVYYELGDYIGESGIEKYYEKELKGEKGVQYFNVDVHGRVKGSYKNGEYDEDAVVGKNLVTTIDAQLQAYGEYLMSPFKGSIVAIEPGTGEILSLISVPGFSPELLVGRLRTKNFIQLQNNSQDPLYNRAIRAKYPPGSTFKLITGLIGLEEGVNYVQSQFYCDMGYYYRHIRVGCHSHDSPLNLTESIQNSCNAYFCNVFRKIIEDPKFDSQAAALDNWKSHVKSFGFGEKLGIDFTYELAGFIPGSEYYNRIYGENRWKFITVLSLAIGQGELGITPVQMANMSATMANRGYYYVPHIVKGINNEESVEEKYKKRNYVSIDTSNFNPIIEGMADAVNGGGGGTAWRARMKDIIICGKTGTAENPHGDDHSIFVAFAPKDDPKIAIAVYVENGGFGNTYAAPIASLMIDKFLTDTVGPERKYLEDHILNAEIEY